MVEALRGFHGAYILVQKTDTHKHIDEVVPDCDKNHEGNKMGMW